MKRRGRHPKDALSGDFDSSVRLPGLYADGNSLYLRIDRSECKRWILRTVIPRQAPGHFGTCSRVSLVEARARARRLRKIAREGGDPFAARQQVFSTRHPEVIKAAQEALELLEKAGVVIDDFILEKLGLTK